MLTVMCILLLFAVVGTALVSETIAIVGGDFTGRVGWEGGHPANPVEDHHGICIADEVDPGAGLMTWNTPQANMVVLKLTTEESVRNNGIAYGNGSRHTIASGIGMMLIDTDGCVIEYQSFLKTGTGGHVIDVLAGHTLEMNHNFLMSTSSGTSAIVRALGPLNASFLTMVTGVGGFHGFTTNVPCILDYCLMMSIDGTSPVSGFNSVAATDILARNCIAIGTFDGGAAAFKGLYHASSDWNLSSDATAPGGNSTQGVDKALVVAQVDGSDTSRVPTDLETWLGEDRTGVTGGIDIRGQNFDGGESVVGPEQILVALGGGGPVLIRDDRQWYYGA